jgi:pimeloyl-ACP methyl ester carboxylesterase
MKTVLRRTLMVVALIGALIPNFSPGQAGSLSVLPAYADGFVDFESGVDRAVIRDLIPGVAFTNTNGRDWVFGDWRTNRYNGKYPATGAFTSNGNFFAWLGETQGSGQITFTEKATYLSVWVSASTPVTLTGFAENGAILDTAVLPAGNVRTAKMDELRITTAGAPFKYAIISGTANQWLIDDLSTDADGVPNSRTPLIFIPGVGGTKFENSEGELWPRASELGLPLRDRFLFPLRLNDSGTAPYEPDNDLYASVTITGIVTAETVDYPGFAPMRMDAYQSTLDFLGTRGYSEAAHTLYIMPYDWRKNNADHVSTLSALIQQIKDEHPGLTQVNILAHSMGGLVARNYIADATRAASVKTLVTLGTPHLGATKPLAILLYNDGPCFMETIVGGRPFCVTNQETLHELLQNFPSAYQLAPTSAYYDITGNQVFNVDYDRNGDGQTDGWQTYSEVVHRLIWEHNFFLPSDGTRFHQNLQGYTSGTNGVAVYTFVGQATGTIGSIREYRRHLRGAFIVTHDLTPVAGDGAVPLDSADMGRRSAATDHSGGVTVYYTSLKHEELPQYVNGVGILPQVADILETGAGPAAAAAVTLDTPAVADPAPELLLAEPAVLDGPQYTPISTSPTPLSGYQFMFNGDANVIAADGQNRRTGMTQPEVYEVGIPGSSLDTLGDATSLFLPITGTYTITVTGAADSLADLRLRHIVNGAVADTVLYKDLDVTAGSLATLRFNVVNPDYTLDLDQNGDGSSDGTREPDAFLNAAQSQDITPPTTQVQIQGAIGPRGWYVGPVTVSAVATDNVGGSGVLRLDYSLDGGRTMLPYTGPFMVESSTTTEVVFLAVDVAGNTEPGFTVAVTGPYRLQLPLLHR